MAGKRNHFFGASSNLKREVTNVEDFYAELLVYAQERKRRHEAGENPEPQRLNSSRKQLRSQLDSDAAGELDQLLNGISFAFYLRGYQDSARHQKTLNRVSRTRKGRARFVREVRNMLERNIEMTTQEICGELDRLRVSIEIRNVDGEEGEKVGPGGLPWSAEPIPDAVEEAIRRIKYDVEHKGFARHRQMLLGLRD
jgi:hypothetical protein